MATVLRESLYGRELTEREIEILALVAGGKTNAEVAERLFLSIETVKSHVRHILEKLGASSRTHAIGLLLAQHPDVVGRIAMIALGQLGDRPAPEPPKPELALALGRAIQVAKDAESVAPTRGRGL